MILYFTDILNKDKLLKFIFKKYQIDKISYTSTNKPYINNDLFVSISHSHDLYCIVVSSFEIGVDIEIIKPRDFSSLSKRFFGFNVFDELDFYRYWTQKESYVKLIDGSVFKIYDFNHYINFQTNIVYFKKHYYCVSCSDNFRISFYK